MATLKLTDTELGALRVLVSIALDAGEVNDDARPAIERVLAKIDAPPRSRHSSTRRTADQPAHPREPRAVGPESVAGTLRG